MRRYSRIWWVSVLLSSAVTGTTAFLLMIYLTEWSFPRILLTAGSVILLGDVILAFSMEAIAPTRIAVGPGERYMQADRSSDTAFVLSGFVTSSRGQVSVRGETWQAIRAQNDVGDLPEGTPVDVIERDGLTLIVSSQALRSASGAHTDDND